MTAKEAREYIARFHLIVGMPSPMSFAEKINRDGSVTKMAVSAMVDDELISLAQSLQSWEAEAAANSIQQGATVN